MAKVDPQQSREQTEIIDIDANRDLDILFVIDNSNSMADEQDSLADNFNRFINVLANIEGGLPNVHLGVVSTDLGAGPYGIRGCTGNGDNGLLQNTPRGACSGPSDSWISDTAMEDGSRITNYSGSLSDAFSCIARLGDTGCGFEQPLEAMRRALNGSNADNAGFLRSSAILAVVIITDEDDCSSEDVRMFDDAAALNTADSSLGFLSSFRCFEFGVQCEPDSPRSIGPREQCVPRPDSQYMYDVSEYVSFLRSLKDDPGDIYVAGIIGDPSNVMVVLEDGEPALAPSCTSSAGKAEPGIRLSAFLSAFQGRNTATTICNENLSDALTLIADALGDVLGKPCIKGDLTLVDGEPLCTVSDVYHYRRDDEVETILSQCNSERSNAPCYYYEPNADCSDTGLSLLTERAGADVPSGTKLLAHCLVN